MPNRPSIVTVRFKRAHGAYNAGVEAGFTPAQAAILVKSGCAIIVHDGSTPAAPANASTKVSARSMIQKG